MKNIKDMKKMMALLALSVLVWACSGKEEYQIGQYFSEKEQDTLMTNIIINIYKTPKGVAPADKRNPEYRSLYVKQIPQFDFIYYHIEEESQYHYFYLIRPARNTKGFKRGVAGKYKIGADLVLTEFEELYVTPMMAEEEIKEKGEFLWKDLMYYNHIDRYALNKAFVEFPDERTRYDKINMEWTYSHE